MSGFVAVLGADEGTAERLLRQLAAPLAAHGPDGLGFCVDGPAGLAHALFATRDGATLGPHRSARGVAIAGDIRIDGQAELRRALRAAGTGVALDAQDDALVLAAWDAWGEDAPSRLIGDFSFALWDPARRVLFCARDGFGVRPLFHTRAGDMFVCSNVLAAVRAHPGVSSRLHDPAIVSFLANGYNDDCTTTTFADIRRLAPGHQVAVAAAANFAGKPTAGSAAVAPRRHWTFPVPDPLVLAREEEYAERYRAILGEAVRDRLRQANVAILLSGGLDSTSLAATARRVAPMQGLDGYTFVVSALQPDEEGRIAADVARLVGLSHEIIDDVPLPLDWFDDGTWWPPEPMDEPEHMATRRAWSRIASKARVLVHGEDADSLFRPPGLATMLRRWPLLDVAARTARYVGTHGRLPHTGLRLRARLRALVERAAPALPDWVRPAAPGVREYLARGRGAAGAATHVAQPTHPDRPEAHAALSASTWQSVIEVNDVAYGGALLEVRWPFLDARVMEFVFSIPPVPWCQRKELVRVAFEGALPREVLTRPKTPLTRYQTVQVERWRAARAGRFCSPSKRLTEFVDADRLRDILERGSTVDVTGAWRALQLDRWLRDS